MRIIILDDEGRIEETLIPIIGRRFQDMSNVGSVAPFADDFGGEQATARDSSRRARRLTP